MLQSAATLLALGLVTTASASPYYSNSTGLNSTNLNPGYNCTAGQSCWPSTADWEKLNTSLSGALQRTVPIAASCYYDSPYYDAATCDAVSENYTANQFRTDVYGAVTALNWEVCQSTMQGCALDPYNTTDLLSDQCYLGSLSSLYVNASTVDHVTTAVKFARAHNMRVSIKNTGHDYYGRATNPNTLAIWTHHFDNMIWNANFTAYNCPAANGQNIGEMGAGVQATNAYTFFQANGMDVTGGSEESVGLAGGFGLGGGHGIYGPSYGLMVDNAVEFDVVTADGEFKTINQCNDPELFWAMRGGGGGTFAVLINYRMQLYPSVKINTYTFRANFTDNGAVADNYQALENTLIQHVKYQPVWSNNNISGYAYYWPYEVQLRLILPSNDTSALKNLTSDFSSYMSNQTNITVVEDSYTTYDSSIGYIESTVAVAAEESTAGLFEILASRLIPRDLFENQSANLVDATIEGIKTQQNIIPGSPGSLQIMITTPVSVQNGNETSANPAWRSALWHLIMAGGWDEQLSVAETSEVAETWLDTIGPLKDLTPGGGCYVNEGHYLEPEWQETFWGSNYPELARIKKKYDPTHFFDCYKCVGWEPSEQYACYDLNV